MCRPHQYAFTLVEVLAALLLMSIVVPMAMQGVSVLSRTETLGQRKAAAARIGEQILNELIATDQASQSSLSGTYSEDEQTYDWEMQSGTWSGDSSISMDVLTVAVYFIVQGNRYGITVSTLYSDSSTTTTTTSNSTKTSS